MFIKKQNGITGIDITLSIIIFTVFITLTGNLIIKTKMNFNDAEKKSMALSYAVQEIEKIKAKGYEDKYDSINQGIIEEGDINDEKGEFTGYYKKIFIEDYKNINNSAVSNVLKKATVKISYKLNGLEQEVALTTYIAKE